MEYKFNTMHAAIRTLAFAALAVLALPHCYSEPNVSNSDITHTGDPNGSSTESTGPAAAAAGLTLQPSVDGGKCLEVQPATGSAASAIGVGTCTGSTAQRWVYTNGQLQSVQGKQCLDVSGNAAPNANSVLTVAACDSNRATQAWIVDRGILYISDGNTQFSLGLAANPPTEASLTHLDAVNFNDASQKWAFNVTAPSSSGQGTTGFHITPSSKPTSCLDVNGTTLVTNPCSDSNSQQWTWLVTGLLQSGNGNNCISLPANPNAGVQPNLVPCDPTVVQELWISTGGEFVNNSLLMCVDATGGSAPNAPVLVDGCNGSATQQWLFGATP